ncbi:LysR family transcriptional regulator [Rhodococcus sp. NPDC078407]|uniref:LysR family transcriptional regulator n=1 Tax=Rhodococcus sp. NPDC078407 TaxID=3364509 RepID=UPI0037CBF6D0
MPTLRALECFVTVVECGSVTAASVRLHLSQPALSHQLASLESEIGTPLLERLPRGVRPTPTGLAVLADAQAALAAAHRVVDSGRALAGGSRGRLRLACVESMTVPVIAPIVRAWARKYRDVDVELSEHSSADAMADSVTGGASDLAVGPASERFAGQTIDIGTEDIVAVIPEGLDLTDATGVSWDDLRGRPMVHYHSSNGLGVWIDSEAAAHGISPAVSTRTRSATTAAQLAHAGLGIALVPTSALPARFGGVVKPLRPTLSRTVIAMVGSPSDPLVQRFIADLLRRGIPSGRPR